MQAAHGDGSQPILELRKVWRQYGSEPAVHALVDVDLRVERGEWLTITGPSGVTRTETRRAERLAALLRWGFSSSARVSFETFSALPSSSFSLRRVSTSRGRFRGA